MSPMTSFAISSTKRSNTLIKPSTLPKPTRPPKALQHSAEQIREFMNFGLNDMKIQIQKYFNYTINTDGLISYLESSFALSASPITKTTEDKHVLPEVTIRKKITTPPSTEDVRVEVEATPPPTQCSGMTLEFICSMRMWTKNRNKRIWI